MKFGIRRRSIDLMPPSADDVEWVFGSGGASSAATRSAAKAAYLAGKFVVGVIRRNQDDKRVGFVMLIPSSLLPNAGGGSWDFTIMIPDPTDRDLFSALHACDAISHYMFDFGKIQAAIWRIREDNLRAQKLGTRFGYPSQGMVEEDGHRFHLFLLDRDTWRERKASLEKRAGGKAFEELRK